MRLPILLLSAATLAFINISEVAHAQYYAPPPNYGYSPPPCQAVTPGPLQGAGRGAAGGALIGAISGNAGRGADDDDRAAAVMFYYGYLAAKAGIRVIDVNQIDGNVRKVMDRCAASPNITVPQAFRQALGRR